MTVAQIAQKLNLKILTGTDSLEKQVSGCYLGDLLSWVMGRAKSGDAWITIMGNVNSIAVAVLADTACIILAENATLDKHAEQKAIENDIVVLVTQKSAFQLACALGKILNQE
jgi:predicted transcriptional regulator